MNDMSQVIQPKSDQWNADDFISGPLTFTIRDVQIRGGQEQPVNILLEGSDKAFRPCKSMSRVLVQAWGPDAKVFVGRSLTLYRDPTVKWGGMEVGGIRISHMSHITGKLQMALTATKGQRKPYVVMPMADAPKPEQRTTEDAAAKWAAAYIASVNGAPDRAELELFAEGKAKRLADLGAKRPELASECVAALEARRASFAPADLAEDDDGFEDEDEEFAQ